MQKPFLIYKVDPSGGSYTAIATGAGNAGTEKVLFDGTWVWTVHDVDPTRVSKINPEDNSITTYTLAAGNNGPRSLLYDGKSIWIGQKPYNYFLVQMDPRTGEYISYDSGDTDHKRVYSMAFDGRHIWAGMDGTVKRTMRWPRTR